MISQVEGLAKALDIDFTHHKVELKSFWNYIPPSLTPISNISFKAFEPKDFDLIISCGRKSVIPSIFLKKNSKKKIYNIHIQDPKVGKKNFDFIVAPEHDELIGENVLNTKGAIHYLSEKEINQNKNYLDQLIQKDSRKLLAFIVGGPNKYYEYSLGNIKKIFSTLTNLINEKNFQLIFIPSFRTPRDIITLAQEEFKDNHTVIDKIDKKAYLSALAISEYIVVTCDSSSMISECAITGKPIYVANIDPRKNDKRFKNFRNLYKNLNIIRNLGEKIEIWSYEKLDETNRVAKIIKDKIKI